MHYTDNIRRTQILGNIFLGLYNNSINQRNALFEWGCVGGFALSNHYKTQNLKYFGGERGGGNLMLLGEHPPKHPPNFISVYDMCFLFDKHKLLVHSFVMTV